MTWRRILKITKWFVGIIVGLMLLISALLLVFKDDIKDYALEEINNHLNKRVHIGYIDVGIWKTFPDMSLEFDDVLVHSKFDTLQTIDTAFYGKKVRLRFNPFDFLESNYSVHQVDIEKAKLNLKILEDGRVNYDFIKSSQDSVSQSFEFKLEEINLSETDFTYINEATGQDYSADFQKLILNGSFNEKQFTMAAKTDFLIHSIKNKSLDLISNKQASCDISIGMDQINHVFEIKSADLKINQLPFQIKGKVTKDSLDFYCGAKSLNLADVATNFTLQQLDVVDRLNGGGDVNIDVHIEGPISNTKSPAIDAEFSVKNGSLSDNGFQLNKILLNGSYSNGVRNGTEVLLLDQLAFHSLNRDFKGNLKITDFAKPKLQGKANGVIDLKAVHRLFGPFKMRELSGNIMVNSNFDIRLNNPTVNPRDISIYDLRASLSVSNITTNFANDTRIFNIPSGEITVRNQYAGFTDLAITLGNSDIVIDGSLNKIADYFNNSGALVVDASVESKELHLNDLSTTNPNAQKIKSWLLPSNIDGKINLTLSKVNYSNHLYESIQGQLHFRPREIYVPYLKGKTASADVSGSLTISEMYPMYLVVNTYLTSNNVSFGPLFKEWNNFDQKVITADNIRGTAAVELDFKGPFDLYEKTDLKDQFIAKARVKITNGALINVSTFKEITESLRSSSAKLVMSKSNINRFEEKLLNLNFETFENVFTIEKGVLTIPKMSIESNALDVNLEGTHAFDNTIDYSFNFRFRDLKSNSGDSEFGQIIDDGTGVKIYLKMYGNLADPKFEWDKEAKKADKKEQREEAKEDFKSVMKTGFGVNKNDTTIQEYHKEKHLTEKVYMDFSNDSIKEEFNPENKKKKKTKLQERIDKWKKENEKEDPEVEFDFN
ncbi:MAG: hypothetical protein COA32_00510 [Fluviicola sp.]|nr:MAG: hypothetical protein COA32_00510 [Fluviicola sp.]